MFSKIKQVQDLRNQAKKIQQVLAEETVEGSGAWGKVKITMNGNQEVKKVNIDQELLANKEKLEDAVKEAIDDSIKKIQKVMASKMSQMGGFPGLQ